jgi:hypothetical protein
VAKLGRVESDLALLNLVQDKDMIVTVKQDVLVEVGENKK